MLNKLKNIWKFYFLSYLCTRIFTNIEYKINNPTPIWPKDGEIFSTIVAPKYDPSNVPKTKGIISLISTSLKETNILEK